MNNHQDLIATLSNNLEPVTPIINPDRIALIWLAVSGFYVVGVTHLLGPIRPNAFTQLVSEPRFLVESLVGVLAIIIMSLIAFRAAVPGALSKNFTRFGIGLLIFWLSFYIVGIESPALEPSMLGKRDYCVFETFIYALPPTFVAYILIRQFYPLHPVQTAFCYSLSAGMIPALYMQVACMYVPAHILQFHIFPGLLVGVLGAGLGLIAGRSNRAGR